MLEVDHIRLVGVLETRERWLFEVYCMLRSTAQDDFGESDAIRSSVEDPLEHVLWSSCRHRPEGL